MTLTNLPPKPEPILSAERARAVFGLDFARMPVRQPTILAHAQGAEALCDRVQTLALAIADERASTRGRIADLEALEKTARLVASHMAAILALSAETRKGLR